MNDRAPTDEVLMSALQGGDHAAYEVLYQRWSARIFHFLIRRTGSRSAAEDALQETWMRVYRFRDRFQTSRRFSSWLYAIAANAGHDARKPEPESFEWEPSGEDHPELRDYLVRALHQLDPKDRRVLLLFMEGFESPEIGQMVNMKPSAVRMRIRRAREKIKATLGALDDG